MEDDDIYKFRWPSVGGGGTPTIWRPESGSPVSGSDVCACGRIQADAYHYLRLYGD